MMGHNIGFNEVIWQIIPFTPSYLEHWLSASLCSLAKYSHVAFSPVFFIQKGYFPRSTGSSHAYPAMTSISKIIIRT